MGQAQQGWNRTFRGMCNARLGLAAAAILLAAGGAQAGARRIDPTQFQQRAVLTDPAAAPAGSEPGFYLGWTVSMSADGTTAVATEALATGTEKAVVFTRTAAGWAKTADLVPSEITGIGLYGFAVAVSGDGRTVVLGSPSSDQGAGAAYVFRRTAGGWSQEAKLVAGDAVAQDQLGESVALSFDGSTAFVGAFGKNGATGAAYVFQRTGAGWVQRQELTASDAVAADDFAFSLALSSDAKTALIGAYGRQSGIGGAYVFALGASGWSQQAILVGSNSQPSDYFGRAVALSANGATALVGAANSGHAGSTQPESAYLFGRSGTAWSERAQLHPSVPAAGFGFSVALNAGGTVALVGANAANYTVGAALLFLRNGSQWSSPVVFPGTQRFGFFGYSVALDARGDRGIVSAFEPAPGEVYVLGLQPTATVLSSSAQPTLVNGSVTYTAHVNPVPSDGTVSFWTGGSLLSRCLFQPVDPTTGAATCTASFTSAGVHPVAAAYSGGAALASSGSPPLGQTVGYGINILSPTAGSSLLLSNRLVVEFTLSGAAGPLSAAAAQQISNACDAKVTVSGVASSACGTYSPSTGAFYATGTRPAGAAGPITITVSVSAGGRQVSSKSITVGGALSSRLPGTG